MTQTRRQRATRLVHRTVARAKCIEARWWGAVATLVTSTLLAYLLVPGSSTSRLLLATVLLVVATPIACRIATATFDLFEPLTIFCFGYAVMFVARPISELSDGFPITHGVGSYGPPAYDVSGTFDAMLVVALAGACGFLAGYFAPVAGSLARRIHCPSERWQDGPVAVLAFGVALLGILLFIASAFQEGGGLGALTDLLRGRDVEQTDFFRSSTAYLYSGVYLLVPAILVLLSVGLRRRRKLYLAGGAALALLVLVRSGPSGGRILLIMAFLAAIVLVYLILDRRPRLVTILVSIVITMMLFSIIRDTRYEGANGPSAAEVLRPDRAASSLITGPDADMAVALAAQMTVVPSELGYLYGGATFGDFFLRMIPRPLWQGKPLSPREEVIEHLYPRGYADGYANPEFSILATMQRDLGWIGAAIGMLIAGVLYRVPFEFFSQNRAASAAQVTFAATVPLMIIGLRDSPVDTFRRLLPVVIPLVGIIWLASVVPRRRSRVGGARPEAR